MINCFCTKDDYKKNYKRENYNISEVVSCANDGSTICVCKNGYTGATGTDDCVCIDKCSNKCDGILENDCGDSCVGIQGVVCQNGAACFNGSCICPTGYTGTFCENSPGPCFNVDCGANGNCVDGSCECINGYTGEYCGNAPGPCFGVVCENGGVCDGGSCNCPDGFVGPRCEIEDKCFDVICSGVNERCDPLSGNCVCESGWTKNENNECLVQNNFIKVSTNMIGATGFHIFNKNISPTVIYTDWENGPTIGETKTTIQNGTEYIVSVYKDGKDNDDNDIISAEVINGQAPFGFIVRGPGSNQNKLTGDLIAPDQYTWYYIPDQNNQSAGEILTSNPLCNAPCPEGTNCQQTPPNCPPISCRAGYTNIGEGEVVCTDNCNVPGVAPNCDGFQRNLFKG